MPTDAAEHPNPPSTTAVPARTNAVQNRTQSNTVEQGRTTSAPKRPQNRANTHPNLTQTVHPKRPIPSKTLDISRSPPLAEKSQPSPRLRGELEGGLPTPLRPPPSGDVPLRCRMLTGSDTACAMSEAPATTSELIIPTDYREGYERARKIDPQVARQYVAHTRVGDAIADDAIAELETLDPKVSAGIIAALMNQEDIEALKNVPPKLTALFEDMDHAPAWADLESYWPGIRMFHRNSKLILGAFVGGVLIEGFSTNISKSFFITGRVRDSGVRRLKQNNRHLIEIFMPGGLRRYGDGWKLSVRIRLIHAKVRQLLRDSDDWDYEAWGEPISAAHVGFAASAFSARLLVHLKRLGGEYSDEERASFMRVWRHSAHLMGIPESMLFRSEAEALRIYEIGRMCEPTPGMEAVSMAHSLVNSGPLVAGVDDPLEREKLTRYVFVLSRAMIGNHLANDLHYPSSRVFGALALFRLSERLQQIRSRIAARGRINTQLDNFSALVEASMFDAAGISYDMPDHVYAEESSTW